MTKQWIRIPLSLSVRRTSANLNRPPGRFIQAVAWLLTVMVLILVMLAVSPVAHAWLHPDAHDSDHDCAVTLYAQGTTVPLTLVSVPLVVWRQVDAAATGSTTSVCTVASHRLPPGCGPPRLG